MAPACLMAAAAATTYTACAAPHVPRTIAKPTWRPACLTARKLQRTHRSHHSENDRRPSHGRSPVWQSGLTTHVSAPHVPRSLRNARTGEALIGREDLHADAPLHTFRRRPRTHAWAKPCLAGRPTALVRTQCCEQNTSRGRPSGMELPDYPVMATLPTPQDQDGPTLPLPAGSFPVLVTRYAARRIAYVRTCSFT
jgi:hypothetical protein